MYKNNSWLEIKGDGKGLNCTLHRPNKLVSICGICTVEYQCVSACHRVSRPVAWLWSLALTHVSYLPGIWKNGEWLPYNPARS